MPLIDQPDEDARVEECIEELDELLMSLDRYPQATVAVALGTCLQAWLGALVDEGECTAKEIREFMLEIERGATGE